MRFLFSVLSWLYVIPLALLALLRAGRGKKEELQRLGIGLKQSSNEKPCYWLVASSVGEVNIATKLIARLKESADISVVLTVTTATGRQQALASDCGADFISFQPFDVAPVIRRFVRKFKPNRVFLIEVELWPVFLATLLEEDVEILQVSGRLSERSRARYHAASSLIRPLMRCYTRFLMQSDDDARRVLSLGARPDHVEVIGSVKLEYQPPDIRKLESIAGYLDAWKGATILTCGSTRPGEEEIILAALKIMDNTIPDLKVVVAPRHLERVAQIAGLFDNAGVKYVRRTLSAPTEEHDVLLLDTLGELALFYDLSEVAFVGGTLVPLGGHNLLEPALAGKPVLYGPHYFSQKPAARLLKEHKMGFEVSGADQFADKVTELTGKREMEAVFAERAETLKQNNSNIVDRYISKMISSDNGTR